MKVRQLLFALCGIVSLALPAHAGVSSQMLTAPTIPSNLRACVLIVKIDKQSTSVVGAPGWSNFLRCNNTDFLWRPARGTEGRPYDFALGSETTVSFGQINSYCNVDVAAPIDEHSKTCNPQPNFDFRSDVR